MKTVLRNQGIPGLELFGTERVCDVFNRVTKTVSVIISGIDAPAEKTKNTCNILFKVNLVKLKFGIHYHSSPDRWCGVYLIL